MEDKVEQIIENLRLLDENVKFSINTQQPLRALEFIADIGTNHAEVYDLLQKEQEEFEEVRQGLEKAVVEKETSLFILQMLQNHDEAPTVLDSIIGNDMLTALYASQTEEALTEAEQRALIALQSDIEKRQKLLSELQCLQEEKQKKQNKLAELKAADARFPLLLQKLDTLFNDELKRLSPQSFAATFEEQKAVQSLPFSLQKVYEAFFLASQQLTVHKLTAKVVREANSIFLSVKAPAAEFNVRVLSGANGQGLVLNIADGRDESILRLAGGLVLAKEGNILTTVWDASIAKEFITKTLRNLEFHGRFMLNLNEVIKTGRAGRVVFKAFEAIEAGSLPPEGEGEIFTSAPSMIGGLGHTATHHLCLQEDGVPFLIDFVAPEAIRKRFGVSALKSARCFAFKAEARREIVRGKLFVFETDDLRDYFHVKLQHQPRSLPLRPQLSPDARLGLPFVPERPRLTLDVQSKTADFHNNFASFFEAARPLSAYFEFLLL